jgi:hypothetical protein
MSLSSVAKADLFANWIIAYKKQDCPTICRATPLKYVMMDGTDHKDRKPISVCTTKKGK